METSSPHGLTLAAVRIEPPVFLAAALRSDGAAALTRCGVQRPLPPSAGATTRPLRWRRRGREAGGRR